MKNPKTMLIAAGALVLLAVGFLFVRGPKPIIEIKAEKLVDEELGGLERLAGAVQLAGRALDQAQLHEVGEPVAAGLLLHEERLGRGRVAPGERLADLKRLVRVGGATGEHERGRGGEEDRRRPAAPGRHV